MKSKSLAISVENISKCYRLGLKIDKDENLAKAAFNFIKSPLTNFRKYRSLYTFDDVELNNGNTGDETHEDILWALNDVSFEVKTGEALGIVGTNGAGKSTLLKILSKIVSPTKGRIEINGKIASLLEVGTGFHPELTGRENIYLNGTILGMTKNDIDLKFEEIVEFSGVTKFIDTPVKRYSSGMTVRLAFAVAAHLEPEILIIDEVLAVGDISFQKKCLGKMREVAQEGRTVLFVSHNLAALENLCTKGILLHEGKLIDQGDMDVISSAYMNRTAENLGNTADKWKHTGTGEARIIDVQVFDSNNNATAFIKMGESIFVEFEVEFYKDMDVVDDAALAFRKAGTGENILHLQSQDCGVVFENISKGNKRYRVEIPHVMLYPGVYLISAYIGARRINIDFVQDVISLQVMQGKVSERRDPFWPSRGKYHHQSFWTENS